LPFDSLPQLRAALNSAHPHLARLDEVTPAEADFAALAMVGGALDKAPLVTTISDFYLTNPIARASKTMVECSALAQARHLQAAE
jgi:NADH-quinone oxidoreductase subunit G